MKSVKGYKWGRKNKIKLARPAALKAGAYAFRDRRAKKRTARQLWNIQLNAAVREKDLSYSVFIGLLKKAGVTLDRKSLTTLAKSYPVVFGKIVDKVSA